MSRLPGRQYREQQQKRQERGSAHRRPRSPPPVQLRRPRCGAQCAQNQKPPVISQGKQALFGDDWNAADSEHGAKISQTLSQALPLETGRTQREPPEGDKFGQPEAGCLGMGHTTAFLPKEGGHKTVPTGENSTRLHAKVRSDTRPAGCFRPSAVSLCGFRPRECRHNPETKRPD